jgi:uncharacterized membrane protein YdbT with pleckstrin-like domain
MTEQNNADPGIVYQARLHWVIFLWPLLAMCVSVYLLFEFESFRTPSLILSLMILLWGGIVGLTYHFSFLLIKKKQVILCTGILIRQTIDIPFNKIESIDIRQSVLGSLLHYGSLVITGTGGTRQVVNYLSKPLTCRRYIEHLLPE